MEALVRIMTPLTPIQFQCLTWIKQIIKERDLLWLKPSYVMAHVRIESGWDPTIKASDYATTGSIGLMQVTAATAADMAQKYKLGTLDQTSPYDSLLTGAMVLADYRVYLMQKWGFRTSILYRPVCVAYNEGPGNVLKGQPDTAYWLKWNASQHGYSFVDGAPA